MTEDWHTHTEAVIEMVHNNNTVLLVVSSHPLTSNNSELIKENFSPVKVDLTQMKSAGRTFLESQFYLFSLQLNQSSSL